MNIYSLFIERCYEDINNILNLGEVPCIFTFEEKNEIIENMKVNIPVFSH